MSAPVYSARFGFEKNTLSWTSSDVPAGYVWVVRDISGVYEGLLGTEGTFALGNVGFFVFNFDLPNTGPFHWEGRVVMYQGEHLDFVSSNDGVDFVISGYQLFLP